MQTFTSGNCSKTNSKQPNKPKIMTTKVRLFIIIWAAGFIGTLSFLLVDISAIVSMIPVPAGEQPPELPPPILLKILTVLQPTVLMTLAAVIGVLLASRVGLHAPAAEAGAAREPFLVNLKPQILPGILTGITGGITIVLAWVVAKPYLASDFISRAEGFNKLMPAVTRFLYGGLTEEVLLRWGFMTLLVWLQWRLLQKGEGVPKSAFVIVGIFVSAIVFGIGHLPIASALSGGLTVPLVAYVITANSIFGIFAGFLYWKKGLESAMIAHIVAHVVLIAAIMFSV
jgi:hypothetical protein